MRTHTQRYNLLLSMCAFVFMVDWSASIQFWSDPTRSKIQPSTWKLERMKMQVNRIVIDVFLLDEGANKKMIL